MNSHGRRRLTLSWLGYALGLTVLLAVPGAGLAEAQTNSWLDAPPQGWNRPGGSLQVADRTAATNADRCAGQERPADGADESALVAAGWRLTTYWPTARAGGVAVVLATTGYDGMCRPTGYQAFVFDGARFAGTLSPQLMASRTDGALLTTPQGGGVALGAEVFEARFVRYAPSDPLCCPSGGQARVAYRLERGAGGPVVLPVRVTPEPREGQPVPTQLPRTGGPRTMLVAAVGFTFLLMGAVARLSEPRR